MRGTRSTARTGPSTSLEDVDHLPQRRRIRVNHIVGQDDRERLVADEVAGHQHGVAEAERLALADVARR